jgi:hypothetical protein
MATAPRLIPRAHGPGPAPSLNALTPLADGSTVVA